MQVKVAESSGFCFGVKTAVTAAEEAVANVGPANYMI